MKKILVSIALITTVFSINACKTTKQASPKPTENAVVSTGIILNNGQKITVVTSSTTDTDMGMGMQMKNSFSSINILNVISTDDQHYSISNTLTKFNMSMDMMGQQTSYDSEKPEDKDSEIGKGISSKLNIPDTSLLDRMTGNIVKQKNDNPEKEEKSAAANPLAGMMDAMGVSVSKDTVVETAFFIIPNDKKTGDSWIDSSSEKKMKTIKTYTIKSIADNIATIIVNTNTNGSGETEMQGTSVSFTMDIKNTGEMLVDLKNNLVNKLTSNGDLTMTMDVMGQSMPISSKINSTIVYQH